MIASRKVAPISHSIRKIGKARPEIAPDARVWVIERWLALYRLTEHGAQIVRIIDGARDLAAIERTPE